MLCEEWRHDVPAVLRRGRQAITDDRLGVRVAVTNTGARHVVQVCRRRTDGPRAGETLPVGFAAVGVPAGTTVEVSAPVDLVAPGAWNPLTSSVEPLAAASR